MNAKSLLRDITLLAVAGTIGWWAHGAGHSAATVYAQHSSSSSARGGDSAQNLAFQLGGAGFEKALTIYSPADHTLYVYPAANAGSNINCAYMLHVKAPGAPVERENCAVGSFLEH